MGDLSELIASIAEKGDHRAAGGAAARRAVPDHRRRAPLSGLGQAGLLELPVVIRDVDDTEMLELALIENLQRKDLTPFEESEALHGLAESCGYTHEDLARRLGKSRTSVTESLALNAIPEEVRNLCRLADISSKSLLLQVVGQSPRENDRPDRDHRQPGRRDPPEAPRRGGPGPAGQHLLRVRVRPPTNLSSASTRAAPRAVGDHRRARSDHQDLRKSK
jgi:ParB family chromosome partitioning protein